MAVKTLADYITSGRHEFLAFVRNEASLNLGSRSNYGTWGNDLGSTSFGVLVCERTVSAPADEMGVHFYNLVPPKYAGDSNIMWHNGSFGQAKVLSEVPLGIAASFWQGNWLKKDSPKFEEARELLKKYGLYCCQK